MVIASLNIFFYYTDFKISDFFNKLNAIESHEYTVVLTNNSSETITIFSGTKIKLNNDHQIYIFESYSTTDNILYCREFKAHQGITVLGELRNKDPSIIIFNRDEISSISIELDESMISLGRKMGYNIKYGNDALAGIGAYGAGYLGAIKGAFIGMPLMAAIGYTEQTMPGLATVGCLAYTGLVMGEAASHSMHVMNRIKMGFIDIPLSGENSWQITSHLDLINQSKKLKNKGTIKKDGL